MHPYILNLQTALFLTAICTFGLGIFVFWAAPRQRLNQIYNLFCFAICVWSASEGILAVAPSAAAALVIERIQHIGVVYIPVLFAHYVLLLLDQSNPRFLRLHYGIATIFLLLLPTQMLLAGVDTSRQHLGIRYFDEPGPYYWVLMLWFFVPTFYGLKKLWGAYRISSGAKRNQIKYVFWGAVIGFFGGCGNYLYVYDVELPWFNPNGTYGVPIYMAMTAYAIVRHRLMDINVVIKKTVIYTLLYSICLGVFGFIVFFLGQWMVLGQLNPRLIGLSMLGLLFVVAMVRPLDLFLTHLTDRILFREKYRYQQTLKAASAGMGRVRNLPRLLAMIARVIVNNVKVSHATIFLKDRNHPRFVVVASRGRLRKPVGLLRLDENSLVVSWLADRKEPVVYEELRSELKRLQPFGQTGQTRLLTEVIEEMERLQAFVCVPSFMDGVLKGFLMLGEKLSSDMYTQEDLDIFATLANQAALAIENAEAYQELLDTRDQLLQSERLATIGKFASDMAHEIKNPLQAIMTYFDFLPEKYNDPDFQKRFAQIAKNEAQRIDHLVRGLVTFTHPRPPRLERTSLHPIVESVLALLESDFERHQVEIRREYGAGEARVEVDRDQMKQVFLNLFMNAVEAMAPVPDRRHLLEVLTAADSGRLTVQIRDTGCGILPRQIPLLFAPFFTTKEKGSGLGLSIVQDILNAHHATIRVDSRLGEGTAVTLEFLLKQEEVTYNEPHGEGEKIR